MGRVAQPLGLLDPLVVACRIAAHHFTDVAAAVKWWAAIRQATTSKLPSANGRSSAGQTTSGAIPSAASHVVTRQPASARRRAT